MENATTIRFELTNEYGSHYTMESSRLLYGDFGYGDNQLTYIGEQLNIFLKQIGYCRSQDYILLEDLSEDEYDYLVDALDEYREKAKEGERGDE